MIGEIWRLGATELAKLIARRKVSAVEVAEATLSRIQQLNPRLNAFLSLSTTAMDDAFAADRRVARKL